MLHCNPCPDNGLGGDSDATDGKDQKVECELAAGRHYWHVARLRVVYSTVTATLAGGTNRVAPGDASDKQLATKLFLPELSSQTKRPNAHWHVTLVSRHLERQTAVTVVGLRGHTIEAWQRRDSDSRSSQ